MLSVRVVSDQRGAYRSTRNIHIEHGKSGMHLRLWNGHGDLSASVRSEGSEQHKEGDELLVCTENMYVLEIGPNLMQFQTLISWKRSCLPMKVDSMDRGVVSM